MQYTKVLNPIWADQEHSAIDCKVDFINIGLVPFTANPKDTENSASKQIFDECIAGLYGNVGEFIPPAPYIPNAQDNKNHAVQLLSNTDWAASDDVGNPEKANPYLENQREFIAFRNQIRPIAIEPIAGNLDWPTNPVAVWKTV